MLLSKYFSVQAPIVQQASLLVVMVQARVLAQQGDVQQAPLLVVESASNKCSTSTLACCKKSANKGVCTTRKCSTSTPACCKKVQTGVFAQQIKEQTRINKKNLTFSLSNFNIVNKQT